MMLISEGIKGNYREIWPNVELNEKKKNSLDRVRCDFQPQPPSWREEATHKKKVNIYDKLLTAFLFQPDWHCCLRCQIISFVHGEINDWRKSNDNTNDKWLPLFWPDTILTKTIFCPRQGLILCEIRRATNPNKERTE